MVRATRASRKAAAPLGELNPATVNDAKTPGAAAPKQSGRSKNAPAETATRRATRSRKIEIAGESVAPAETARRTRAARGRKAEEAEEAPEAEKAPVARQKSRIAKAGEGEEAQDEAPAKRATRGRSKAKVVAGEEPADVETTRVEEPAPSPVRRATRARSKAKQETDPEQPAEAAEPEQENIEPERNASREASKLAEEHAAEPQPEPTERDVAADLAAPSEDSDDHTISHPGTAEQSMIDDAALQRLVAIEAEEPEEPEREQSIELEQSQKPEQPNEPAMEAQPLETTHSPQEQNVNSEQDPETQDSFVTAADENEEEEEKKLVYPTIQSTPDPSPRRRATVASPIKSSQDEIADLSAWASGDVLPPLTQISPGMPALTAETTVSVAPQTPTPSQEASAPEVPKPTAKIPRVDFDALNIEAPKAKAADGDDFAHHVKKLFQQQEKLAEARARHSIAAPSQTAKPAPNEARKRAENAAATKTTAIKKPAKTEKTLKLKRPSPPPAATSAPVKDRPQPSMRAPAPSIAAARTKPVPAPPAARPPPPSKPARAAVTKPIPFTRAAPPRPTSLATPAKPAKSTKPPTKAIPFQPPPPRRPDSLATPAPVAKSTKPPTRPQFELPGAAVQRRLAEAREERLRRQEDAEKQRAAEDAVRRKREVDEERRRREEKARARPVPKGLYRPPQEAARTVLAAAGEPRTAKEGPPTPPRLLQMKRDAPTTKVDLQNASQQPVAAKKAAGKGDSEKERAERAAAVLKARREAAEAGKETARLWAELQRQKAERRAAQAAAGSKEGSRAASVAA